MEKSYFEAIKQAADPLMTGLMLRPDAGKAFIDHTQAVMRGDSLLPPAFRELIGAFVSGLNGCELCRTAHTRVAELLGYPASTTEALLQDVGSAPVSDRERVLLTYIKTLTLSPASLGPDDAKAVFAAGWSEDEFHDALNVACNFNFINRFVLGHGIKATTQALNASARKLARRGYG